MQKNIKILTSLIRYEICGAQLEESIRQAISPEILPDLLKISQEHSIAHLIGDALYKNELLYDDAKISEEFKQCQLVAFCRHIKQEHEFKKIINTLENAGISFMPLKGSVIRQFYKEPYMRTACDIDVLVWEDDLEKAIECLEKELKYVCKTKSSHEVKILTPSGENIELHFDLIEKGVANLSKEVLRGVWTEATHKRGYKNYMEMNSELFYFYHIAHMVKHFIRGGCGVRAFLDLWLINKNMSFDEQKKTELLIKGGLLTFAQNAEKLANVWFSGEEYTDTVKKMEHYIFDGGMYGTLENQVAMRQAQTGSKLKSAWEKIFLKYDIIKFYYPVLQKHKWLLPYYEVKRWCKLIFVKEERKRSVNHLSINQSLTKDVKSQMKELRDMLDI